MQCLAVSTRQASRSPCLRTTTTLSSSLHSLPGHLIDSADVVISDDALGALHHFLILGGLIFRVENDRLVQRSSVTNLENSARVEAVTNREKHIAVADTFKVFL